MNDRRIHPAWIVLGALTLSMLAASGLLMSNPLLHRTPGHAFKLSITHGLLSAYAAFAFAVLGIALAAPFTPARLPGPRS